MNNSIRKKTKDLSKHYTKEDNQMAIKHMKSSVQFSRSVVSNSLRHHELQHARPPCPSKLMSIESVIPSNCLIVCRPLLRLPSIFPSIRVFPNCTLISPQSLLHSSKHTGWEKLYNEQHVSIMASSVTTGFETASFFFLIFIFTLFYFTILYWFCHTLT